MYEKKMNKKLFNYRRLEPKMQRKNWPSPLANILDSFQPQ